MTAVDTDSDGTDDCADDCPQDANKTTAGVCGCGVADTDTDGDGSADCVDSCENDASKTQPGVCGCGVADSDTDGNGILDCLDPSATTQPSRPRVKILNRRKSGKRIIVVVIPKGQFQNVTYTISVAQRGRVVASKGTSRLRARFRLGSTGRHAISYTVSVTGGATSQASPKRKIRL